jgi:PAS domain S-box-containing protein
VKASLTMEAANVGSTSLQRTGSPKVRWRLILFATACMAVAVSLAGAVHLSQARQERVAAEGQMQRAARIGAQFVEQQIALAAALLSSLSESPSLQDGDFAAFYRQVSAIHVLPGSWFLLVSRNYASRADQIVNTRRPFDAPPQSEPATEATKSLVESVVATRQVQVSDLVYTPLTNGYVVGVGVPVIRDEEVAYVLILALPEVNTEPAFEGGLEGFGGVVDRSGQLLPGHGLADRAARQQPPFDPAHLRDAGAEGALDGTASDGTPLYIAFSRSEATGWTVFFGMPKPGLDAPIDRARLIVGIGVILLPMAGVAIALLAGPGVILPLRRRIEEDDERARVIAATVPSMLFTADQDGACDYASERFYEYTGRRPGTVEGHAWMAVIHPEDKAKIVRRIADRPETRKVSDLELRLRGKDGSYRWFAIRVTRVSDASGKGMRIFGTATDIDDLKRTESTLRQLSTQLMKGQDDERRRIAREIHDTTVQSLVAAKMQIDQAQEGVTPLGVSSAMALRDAHKLLNQSLSELRTLSYLLHPPMLDELGLAAAVRWYAQGFQKRSGITVSVDASALSRLPTETETTLFRVVQEGLANVHRHSGSPEARISLVYHPEWVELEIADIGKGMSSPILDEANYTLGVGIPGMRVRVQQLGGSLELKSTGHGTTLRVAVPLEG